MAVNRLALIALYPLLVFGLAVTAFRYLACIIGNPAKAWRIALMLDETCNVDANGRVDETISHRAALAKQNGRRWGCILCRILDAIQRGHCGRAMGDVPR